MPDSTQPCQVDAKLTARIWLLLVLTGAGAGVAGGLLMKLLRLVQHLSYRYRQGDFLTAVAATTAAHRVLVLLLAGTIAAAVLLVLRRLPSRLPADLTEAIRKHNGELDSPATAIRALLSIAIVGMGAAVGREQALKQAGALIAGRISAWARLDSAQKRLLAACGAGAGMAAAYNVPLGGALFAVEVLLGSFGFSTVVPALAVAVIATAVSWTMLPNTPTYRTAILPPSPSLLLFALLAGPAMGLASAGFVRMVKWGKRRAPRQQAINLLPIPVFGALGALAIVFPQVLGNGRNVIQLVFDAQLAPALLCCLLVLRPIATAVCFRAGAPGGVFTPTMTFGALLGAVLGEGWSHLAPAADKRSYALLGAGAVLAAATQAPLSSVAFMLELTYNAQTLIVPLLIAMTGATLAFRAIERDGVY